MSRKLETIKDYDLSVGSYWNNSGTADNSVLRVHSLPPASAALPEVRLITWLLLEKEYNKKKPLLGRRKSRGRIQCDTVDSGVVGAAGDQSELDLLSSRGREYATELLQSANVHIPFQELEAQQKEQLFKMFCPCSDLLTPNEFSSVAEMYEILRGQNELQNQYEEIRELGAGSYGKVMEVVGPESMPGKRNLALKKVIVEWDTMEDLQMVLNECNILRKLKGNRHIVQYKKSWLSVHANHEEESDEIHFYLLMELCSISLYDWKTKVLTSRLEEGESLRILYQIIDGLEYIHEHGCLHLDLNPRNIFWSTDRHERIKIGDFGLAIEGNMFDGRSGSDPYAAPEDRMTFKSDIYSAAVSILEITHRTETTQELIHEVEKFWSHDTYTETGSTTIFYDILQLMISRDPEERPDIPLLKELMHDFIY